MDQPTQELQLAECERLRHEHPERDLLIFAPHEVATGVWEVRTARLAGVDSRPRERREATHPPPEVRPVPDEGRVQPSPWWPWQS
jgi:hypothetical protein